MSMLRVLLLSSLLVVPDVVSAATGEIAACPSTAFGDRIANGLAGYADVVDLPGVSVGIVHRGRLVHTASYGFANRSQGVPATSATLYNVASVTKPFTATLALMMAAEGVLDLDAPVARYVRPGMQVPLDASGAQITVRHLLGHTAGLPKNPPNRRNQATGSALNPGVWDTYSLADLAAALPQTKLEGKVGQTYLYSNYGYALLGHALEHVAGIPYETLLRNRLLEPLGMADTAIALSPDQQARVAEHYWAEDLARSEQSVRPRFGEVAAAIGLTSSVDDLSKFVAAHLGQGGARNPIPEKVAAQMREGQRLMVEDGPYRFEMGLGWQRVTPIYGGEQHYFHPGTVDGHTAGLFLMPGQDLGVIVLQDLGGVDGEDAIERFGQWLMRIAAPEFERCDQ